MAFRLSLRQKGLVLVCVPLLFEVAFVGLLSFQLQQAQVEVDKESRGREIVSLTQNLADSMYRIGWNLAIYVEKHDDKSAALFKQAMTDMRDRRSRIHELVQGNSVELAKFERVEKVLFIAEKYCTRIETVMTGDVGFAEIIAMRNGLERLADELATRLRNFSSDYQLIERDSPANQAKRRSSQSTLLVGALVFNIALTLVLAWYFTRSITGRLAVLTDNTGRLAREEDLLPRLSGSDEIADLDSVFHSMASGLRDAAEKERALLRHTKDVICALDRDGRFCKINPACKTVWGFDELVLINRPVYEYLAEETEMLQMREVLHALRKQGGSGSVESGFIRADETRIDLLWSVYWSQADGLFFCSTHDVTDRKQIERLKQDFYSMVTHDLRTPLTSVKGMVTLITEGAFGAFPVKIAEKLGVVQKNVERLITMINDLLDLDKLEAGKMPLEIASCKSADIILRAIQAVETYAEQQGIELESACPPLDVRADGDRLIQVLINFISNAVKFSPKGSKVSISAVAVPGCVEFRCRDHGRGIPQAFQSAIFERFQQVQAADARRNVGTGLGLAVCKLIIEAHGGTIGVVSSEGAGSTFWFRVPRAMAPKSTGTMQARPSSD